MMGGMGTPADAGDPPAGRPAPYQLQAVIASCHAAAASAADTDWATIARVYGQLARIAPSPVVELNRAVAVGMAQGPQAAQMAGTISSPGSSGQSPGSVSGTVS